MKIIQLKNLANGFASIDFADIDMNKVLKEGKVDIIQGKSFKWNKSTGDLISDSPFYIGAMPIFDTKKLGNALSALAVKSATFDVEGHSYTIIAAPQLKGNVINRDQSEMRTFRSGKIMNVSKYVFTEDINYPEIFTLEEFTLSTFCMPDIAKLLLSCKFAQLQFSECSVK
jgi:hypothetical protein